MADSTILREYLLALGFKVDEDQFRKIEHTIKATVGVIGSIGAAAAVAATLVDKYVVQMAGKFDDLYYASIQTKSSITNLQAYSYAAKMVGLDGHAAAAGIANMARALRTNPMLSGRLQMLGVKPGRDTATMQSDLIHQLAKMPRWRALQFGEQFGQDPDTLNQILDHLGAYDAAAAENKRMYARAGINEEDVGKNSMAFDREIDRLEAHMEVLKTILLINFLPTIDKLVVALDDALNWLSKHPKLTVAGGLGAGGLAVGGTLLGGLWTTAKLLQLGGKQFAKGAGIRGGAEELGGEALIGGEAAGGEAAMTGVGALAAAAAPVVLAILGILGLGFAIYEIIKHHKEIQDFSDKTRTVIGSNVRKASAAIGKEAKWEWKEGSAEIGSLLAYIRRSEGGQSKDGLFRQYLDQGKKTIGYGHHLLPGENYTTIDQRMADRLLKSDLAKADGVVSRLLPGVKLSDGMRRALDDFQFNSGGLSKARTLLADLRAGRTEKAANDFALYGGYHDAHGVFHPGGSDAVSRGLLDRRLGDGAMARSVTVHQKTDIHVDGAKDPQTVARHTLNGQKYTNADLARNVAAAAGAF